MGTLLVQPRVRADEQEWAGLIARTAQGDQMALAALYDRTSAYVHGLVLKILGDPHQAEEVTLDVFTQVWRQAHTYDEGRGAPGSWLLTLARSRAIDRLRAGTTERVRQVSLESVDALPDESGDPEQASIGAQRQRLVARALAGLAAEQREAIALAYFAGLSQSEIATKLELPLGTVKTRIRLGMIKMRDLLAPYQDGLAL